MPDQLAMIMFDTPKRAFRFFTPIVYMLARWGELGRGLEIGTGTAFQSTRSALGGFNEREEGGQLVSIDIRAREHRVPPEYMDMWTFIEGDSTDERTVKAASALGQYDWLLHDGSHDPDVARKDLALYGPLVKPGGHILIHDPMNPKPNGGIKKLWDEELSHDGQAILFGPFPGLAVLQV